MKQTTKVLGICIALVALVLLMGGAAWAQNVCTCTPERMMQRMTGYLDLTPAQQTKARGIFQTAFHQARGVLTPAQLAQLKTLRSSGYDALQGLDLTAAQREQMQAIREQARINAQAIKGNPDLCPMDQRAQLRALRQSTMRQMMHVLTPAQLQQFKEARAAGENGFRALNLTAEQKTKLQGIRDNAMAQFRAILTPEQQAKFDQFVATHPDLMR